MHWMIMRIFGISLFALLVASGPVAPGWAQATTIHENVTIPINHVTINPCTGEEIALSGDAHFVLHFTFDESGGGHGSGHTNLQGVSGVGLTSGDVYRLVAVSGGTSNFIAPTENGTVTITSVSNTRIVGPGPDNNFLGRFIFHATVNANGELTTQFADIEARCQ